ncbi:MAG TPA: hypothetical protein VIV12_05490 [Streptosporangiaceae bacterium]
MLLKIVYMLACRIPGLIVVLARGDQAVAAGVVVLRHENAVLRRHAGRVRYESADRAWFAALARIVSRRRWARVFPVTPATLLAWRRRLVARKYDTSGRCRPGRPATAPGIRRLVLRAWRPLCGHRRDPGRAGEARHRRGTVHRLRDPARRDRGPDFTASSGAVFQAAGGKILRTAVQVPRMNATCERLVGTLRREPLDPC